MTSHTSILAFQNLQASLSTRQAAALGTVRMHPGKTAREYEKLSGSPDMHKRLPELEERGLIKRFGVRDCSVTGRRAWAWKPLEQYEFLPKVKTKPPTRARLLVLLRKAALLLDSAPSQACLELSEQISKELRT